jgi:hypothetical protein
VAGALRVANLIAHLSSSLMVLSHRSQVTTRPQWGRHDVAVPPPVAGYAASCW